MLFVSNPDDDFVAKLIESLSEKGVHLTAEPDVASHALLTMPEDEDAAGRAIGLAESLDCHLVFIANELDPQHQEVMAHIRASDLPWTFVQPVAMMDFAFAALPPQVHMAGVVFGISGQQPVGFVAASDIVRVLAAIVEGSGHEGQEYVCSGAEALTMPEVVAVLGEVLGRDLDYIDLGDDELAQLMVQHGGQDPDRVERLVMRELRAWRDGRADIVTDTVARLTGQPPMSVAQWFEKHADDYAKPGLAQKAAAKLVRARYRGRILR